MVVQFVVAAAWVSPPYSWRDNAISDLGATICGTYGGREVCSPDAWLMNVSFVLLGITMIVGSWLIYHQVERASYDRLGFVMMALAGLGTVLVGVFPENVPEPWHGLGAVMAFGLGDLALVVFALTLHLSQPMRAFTLVSGVTGLTGLALYGSGTYLGLGLGGMERVAGYPQTVWLIVFGAYLTLNYLRHRKMRGISMESTKNA